MTQVKIEPELAPTKEEAAHFVLMMAAGVPAAEAYGRYFAPETVPVQVVVEIAGKWLRHPYVKKALEELQGKGWEALQVEERIRLALDKHYSELAYLLYSRNYLELSGGTQTKKADTARTVLEVKLAGLAGKLDPLSRFWTDLTEGKIQVTKPSVLPPETVQ